MRRGAPHRGGMTKTFEGKVVVVTGASSGIGLASALAFEAAGAVVFGVARRKDALEAARAAHPRITWVLGDVADKAGIGAAIERVAREAGRIDVLVNNAAIFAFGPLGESSEEMVRGQLEINVAGVVFATQAALPALLASRGAIVNIGSAAGHRPAAGASIYAATKAAIESLTKSWAAELAPRGVRVNAVAPGPTDTPGFDKLPVPKEMVPAIKDAFVKQTALGRMATTDEIAHWVVAVAAPPAVWMTGHVLQIDGGMSVM